MAETKVARRYAKSLLDLGKERQVADALFNDMSLIQDTLRANKALASLFKSPIVNTDKKDAIVKGLFGNKINEVTLEFIQIITRKKREYYLEDIAAAYVALYKHYKNIQPAYVVTAAPLDNTLRQQLLGIVHDSTQSKVELEEKIDASIIGGFILRWGDRQIDASVSNKLQEIRKNFKQNLYVKDY